MKKITNLILVLFLLTAFGCADHYPEYAQHQAEVDNDNLAIASQYFAAGSGRDAMVMAALGESGDKTALVMYAFMQGQRDAKVAEVFKSEGLEAPKTGMDVWDTFMGSTIPTIAKWGFGYMLGSDLISALGAASTVTTVGGDYVNTTTTLTNSGEGDITSSLDYSKIDNSVNNTNTGTGTLTVAGDETDNSTSE